MAAKYESSLKRLAAWATINGLELRTVGHNELFIDLDDVDDPTTIFPRLELIERYLSDIDWVFKRRSRSGKGWHLRAVMPVGFVLDIRERCFLHAIVGSDLVRELLRMRSIRLGTEDQVSCFIEDPKVPEELMTEWPTQAALGARERRANRKAARLMAELALGK